MLQPASLRTGTRRSLVIGGHLVLWSLAFVGAYLLRFDGSIPPDLRARALNGFALLLLLRAGTFWQAGLFHGMMRYAGIPEVKSIIRASTVATVLLVGVGALSRNLHLPRSIYVGEWLLAILFASSLRLSVRMLRERNAASGPQLGRTKRAVIIGAGDTGEMLLRDLNRVPQYGIQVMGLLDDDRSKQSVWVRGVRVMGPADAASIRRVRDDLGVELAVLAIPSASGQRTREIVAACREAGLETKTLPGLQQIFNGEVSVSMLRDVAIDDLLRREPIELDEKSMGQLLGGRRILVTGGAGSIGSELARQALRFEPSAVALLDHNENALFFLERELLELQRRIPVLPIIADIKDPKRIRAVLEDFRPHVILHAAAHKHVPLMEANPAEAIKNNVFGTRVVADLAAACGVETFVAVSTDKAVNPTSVMGTSKRIAEMYLQMLSVRSQTRFVAVRFGNVLGSAGSVVQVFREQIAKGGPVTVTHPEMTRYFMTIPEACQLVLQAGALAHGGEIFLLDMGEPVKIVDLARDMIRMSGYEPDSDIRVEFSGVRPGEKLYEELLLDSETHARTVHPKILVGRIAPVEADFIEAAMRDLAEVLEAPPDEVRRVLSRIVPHARLSSAPSVADPAAVRLVLRELEPLSTLTLPEALTSSG